jgi:hypothetical protein
MCARSLYLRQGDLGRAAESFLDAGEPAAALDVYRDHVTASERHPEEDNKTTAVS